MGQSSAKPRVRKDAPPTTPAAPAGRPSALLDTRVIYCGDNLEQLAKLPDACVDRPMKSSASSRILIGFLP
jgi:hypothetical protein